MTPKRKVVLDTPAKLLSFSKRVMEATETLVPACRNGKEPCLQSKKKLNPDKMCITCRAYWHAMRTYNDLVDIFIHGA
jgi:hypothetical protein